MDSLTGRPFPLPDARHADGSFHRHIEPAATGSSLKRAKQVRRHRDIIVAWKTGQSPAIMVDRDSGVEVKPEVVDAHTGTPLDVRRVRVVARAPAAAARS